MAPRFERHVLRPLLSGSDARYQVRDWANDEFGTSLNGWKTTEWAERLTYRIWVEAPKDLRLYRGVQRDGENHRQLWVDWVKEEPTFFAEDGTRARADLRVNGQPRVTHDQETEVVVLDQ